MESELVLDLKNVEQSHFNSQSDISVFFLFFLGFLRYFNHSSLKNSFIFCLNF
ncbi:hypothetical protein C4J91_0174 [Pseudomonas sp. R3-52-08]|nr:hypothetical protein C4J91_0174 [Pseudomonas sp. R3-52-08]